MSEASGGGEGSYLSYEDFGVRFFQHAVTAERIQAAFANSVGKDIEFGPKSAGPGRVATIMARGRVDDVSVVQNADNPLNFQIVLAVGLRLSIGLAAHEHNYNIRLKLRLNMSTYAAEPLRLVIDIGPPKPDEVDAVVEPEGLRAAALRRVARIDQELRRYVAKYIAREIEKPNIQRFRDIDIAERIDQTWSR